MQSYRRFGQAFLADVYAHRGETVPTFAHGTDTANPDELAGNDAPAGETRSRERRQPSSVAISGESAVGSQSVIDGMVCRLRETSSAFEWLEHVVDRWGEWQYPCAEVTCGRRVFAEGEPLLP